MPAPPLYLLTARTKFGVSSGGLRGGCHVTKALARSWCGRSYRQPGSDLRASGGRRPGAPWRLLRPGRVHADALRGCQ